MIDHQDLATLRAQVHAVRIASKRRDGRAAVTAPQTRLRKAVVAAACACIENIGRKIPDVAPGQPDGYLSEKFACLSSEVRKCVGTVDQDAFVDTTLESITDRLVDHHGLPARQRPKLREFPVSPWVADTGVEVDP